MHVGSFFFLMRNKQFEEKEAYSQLPCKIELNRLANMSKFKEAIMDFRQAITLQPSNDQARSYLDSTIAQEEHMRLNVSSVASVQANLN